ncbi:hypothetical protein JTB14_030177 [Gonioctena quinquepunctata]|nr:hypothetical protein JTB14_030177 [Gonioctena quinquepunctata]
MKGGRYKGSQMGGQLVSPCGTWYQQSGMVIFIRKRRQMFNSRGGPNNSTKYFGLYLKFLAKLEVQEFSAEFWANKRTFGCRERPTDWPKKEQDVCDRAKSNSRGFPNIGYIIHLTMNGEHETIEATYQLPYTPL